MAAPLSPAWLGVVAGVILMSVSLPASAGEASLAAWARQYGPPSQDPLLANRVRGRDEPLLVYWMATQAAPLGVGPVLPGTMVANFRATPELGDSPLQDFTFLAVATPEQQVALEAGLRARGWVVDSREEQRGAGRYRDLTVELPDGQRGTVALRVEGGSAGMADGRPAPTVWIHLGEG